MHTKEILNVSRLALFMLFIACSACGQGKSTLPVDKSQVAFEFQYIYKAGETSVSAIDLKDVPNGSKLPNGYTPLANKTFNIKNDAIVSGETMVTVAVPVASQEEFQKVRILTLIFNELNPSGVEWHDCTIGRPKFPSEEEEELPESEKERRAKFFPDFAKKQISCGSLEPIGPNNYFALGIQTMLPPTEPATQITTKLESTNKSPENGETIYILAFKNTGKNSVSEVNFHSNFDDDTMLVAVRPGQGRCQKSKLGISYGSVVCYLGPLAQGATANVEFVSQPGKMGGLSPRPRPNFNWWIEGFVKQNPNDSTQLVNKFTFEPIAN
jgi:hypothetical protein